MYLARMPMRAMYDSSSALESASIRLVLSVSSENRSCGEGATASDGPSSPVGTPSIQCCSSGSGIRCLFDPWVR